LDVWKCPRLPTWALQQVGRYLGYTGHGANIFVKAACDPTLTQVIVSDLLVCFNCTVELGSAM
jgi:hypothetical protein